MWTGAVCERAEGLMHQQGKVRGSPTHPTVLTAAARSSSTLGPLPFASNTLPSRRSIWLGTGGVQGRHPLSGGQSSRSQDSRHFLTSGSDPEGRLGGAPSGGIPAGIPTPTTQFVHFLPWLQISTISLTATSGLCPLPGLALTLAGDRTVLVLPAQSLEAAMPSASILLRGP